MFTLNADEQRDLAQAAVAGAAGKVPVVIGAGGGYRLALRMARNAEHAGADAILLFFPPCGSESAEGAYQYFCDIAIANSIRIGVIAYPHGKEDYWPAVLRGLAGLPNVVGYLVPTERRFGDSKTRMVRVRSALSGSWYLIISFGSLKTSRILSLRLRQVPGPTLLLRQPLFPRHAMNSGVSAFPETTPACDKCWPHGLSPLPKCAD